MALRCPGLSQAGGYDAEGDDHEDAPGGDGAKAKSWKITKAANITATLKTGSKITRINPPETICMARLARSNEVARYYKGEARCRCR